MRYLPPLRRAVILAGLALAVWGCRPGPAADIPPDWLWNQDQTLIVPSGGSRNAWNGWTIEADAFVAQEYTSRLILWLKTGRKAKLQITYTLNGRPVRLLINKRTSFRLEPTPRASIPDRSESARGQARRLSARRLYRQPGAGRAPPVQVGRRRRLYRRSGDSR